VHEAEAIVCNDPGIHARPAALLVQKASAYKAQVYLATDRLTVNAKSIMGVMMLAAETGTALLIRAEGPDEEEAVIALKQLIESGFAD